MLLARRRAGWLRSYNIHHPSARFRSGGDGGLSESVVVGAASLRLRVLQRASQRATPGGESRQCECVNQRFVASSTASTLAVSADSLISQLPVSNTVERLNRAVTVTNTNDRSNASI